MRSHFIGSVLVVVIGVNLAAWSLSVGFSPSQGVATIPITPQGIQAQQQTASVVVSIQPTSQPNIIPTPNYHENTAATSSPDVQNAGD